MAHTTHPRLLLHAPNVHVGGGLSLLRQLLGVRAKPFAWLQLDRRIEGLRLCGGDAPIAWVDRTPLSRVFAEWRLYRECGVEDVVLCFHGLPPLLPLRGRVLVFAQNRLLFESGSLRTFPVWTRLRLLGERFLVRRMARHDSRYVVQTESMAMAIRRCLGRSVEISVLPFASSDLEAVRKHEAVRGTTYDFVYVASGDAHKNHVNLLAAWRILAERGIRPSLAVTVDPARYPGLVSEVERLRMAHDLSIVNCGWLTQEAVEALYQSSSALIYPSRIESFGLPLIEAKRFGLRILASELDFVRDVVTPDETFDPDSPLSIARAVLRYLNMPDSVVRVETPESFLEAILK